MVPLSAAGGPPARAPGAWCTSARDTLPRTFDAKAERPREPTTTAAARCSRAASSRVRHTFPCARTASARASRPCSAARRAPRSAVRCGPQADLGVEFLRAFQRDAGGRAGHAGRGGLAAREPDRLDDAARDHSAAGRQLRWRRPPAPSRRSPLSLGRRAPPRRAAARSERAGGRGRARRTRRSPAART